MAGLELVRGVDHVLNLRTGEMLVLDAAPLDDLAEARQALGELWHTRTTAAMMIDAELVRRADEALRTGDDFGRGSRFRVYVDRGGAIQYDSNSMRAELLQLAHRDELPITLGAIERLFTVTQYRLDLHGWRNIVKRWPELERIAERHSSPKRRGTKVERLAIVEGSATEEGAAA